DGAMALSGAAVAPSTSEDVPSFVLRVAATFGANLGRWVDHASGNETPTQWWKHAASLFGRVDATSGTAFISDGGHVENLGLYALLRRRCALVLAIDGEEDPAMTCHGLMRLQHLVRVEQGIELDVDIAEFALEESGRTGTHVTVIPVRYPAIPARN